MSTAAVVAKAGTPVPAPAAPTAAVASPAPVVGGKRSSCCDSTVDDPMAKRTTDSSAGRQLQRTLTSSASRPPTTPAPASTVPRAANKARIAFMMKLKGLLDTLVGLLPGNQDLLRAEVAVDDVTALYPSKIIELWGTTVLKLCGAQLLAKDLDYFMALDVPATLQRLQDEGGGGGVLEGLDAQNLDAQYLETLVESSIRAPIRSIQLADQTECMSVLSTMTSLAAAYHAAMHPPN